MSETRNAACWCTAFCIAAALAFSACSSIERAALPSPELKAIRFAQLTPNGGGMVDHAAWDRFLDAYVATDAEGINRVDYGRVSAADRQALDAYLASLEAVDSRSLGRPEQLAYWLNFYNAATVDIVLEAYPVGSIRKITDGPLSFGPWDRPIAEMDGQPLTLNDIEHGIIRPVFADPRIHYALNCAAAGCPNLALDAWRVEGLYEALDAAEQAYIHDPRGVRIDTDGDLVLSKIYIWFQEDFGENEAAVIERLRLVGDAELRAKLEGRTSVDRYDYDWRLNDQSLAPTQPAS